MRVSLLASLTALAAAAVASPLNNHVLHEKRDFLHNGWTKQKRADPSGVVPVRIGMVQSNMDKAHDLLMEVSHPDSPKYGQHYTEEEVIEIFAPSSDTVAALRAWLEAAGLGSDKVGQSYNKQWLQFDTTIEDLEELLHTEYHEYHDEEGELHLACDEYSVPSHIKHHIDFITPGIKLMSVKKKKRQATAEPNPDEPLVPGITDHRLPIFRKPVGGVPTNNKAATSFCDSFVTPNCIKTMYNITQGTRTYPNQFGVYEALLERYNQTDLNDFYTRFYPTIPQGTHPKCASIDGGTCLSPTEAGVGVGEANLDLQCAYPIIWPSNQVFYAVDDVPYNTKYQKAGFLNNFFAALDGSYCQTTKYDPHYPDPHKGGYKGQLACGKFAPAKVISISYGEVEGGLPPTYVRRSCNEILKLGMQGTTVVVSSGDYGVAGAPDTYSPNGCLSNPPNRKKNGTIFVPSYPAICPYVLSVGSTFLPQGASAESDEEVATTRFPSGGGFSFIYKAPSYQKSAVNTYLRVYNPPYPFYKGVNERNIGENGGVYNRVGRGFPDVSAVGDNIITFFQGEVAAFGGTSASSPIMGSILARINMERIAAGKSTIGFVNPTLYKNPDAFHDITVGNNPGCGTDGFSAAPGWDPVTGLGTPNYPSLLKVFMALP